MTTKQSMEISLAPMMDVTTACFRKLMRLTSDTVVLFTEMLTSSFVVYESKDRLKEKLGEYDEKTVVQLGGSDSVQMMMAVKILQELGYRKFNINCGCPSEKVGCGSFGAILMLRKEIVADVINMVYEETGVILSLKIRTGVDENDGFDFVYGFISYIKQKTPARVFYIHARKCWLKGVSPKQNREIPELNYETVYMIKEHDPELRIILNGSISENDLHKARNLDGLMIGREAIKNGFVFWEIDEILKRNGERILCPCSSFFEDGGEVERSECNNHKCKYRKVEAISRVLKQYFDYFSRDESLKYSHIKPIENFLSGVKGCKAYKKKLNRLVLDNAKTKEVHSEIMNIINRCMLSEEELSYEQKC